MWLNGSRLLLASTAISTIALFSSLAHAQDRPTTESAAKVDAAKSDDEVAVEEVVVTGTNIRGTKPVGSPALVITREEIQQSGMTSAADLLRAIPQFQNSSALTDQPRSDSPVGSNPVTGGGDFFQNQTSGNALDLRGLGQNATLILVDGRRQLAGGTTTSFTEVNRIPLAAIERIEIITDGASAIYGSDAVGGVVNYITRKDYRGGEVSARYVTNDYYVTRGYAATAGMSWAKFAGGNLLISLDREERNRMSYAATPRIGTDLRRYGGNNNLLSQATPAPSGPGYFYGPTTTCPPGTIFIGFLGQCVNLATFATSGFLNAYFDLPAGVTGAPSSATPALPIGAQPLNIRNTDALRDYLGKLERNSANLYVTQNLTDDLSLYYQGSYTERETESRRYGPVSVSVARISPFYPTAPLPGVTPNGTLTVPVGADALTRSTDKSSSHTLGFRAELPFEWSSEGYVSIANSETCGACTISPATNSPSATVLSYLASTGQYNPFTGVIPDDIRAIATPSGRLGDQAEAESTDLALRFNGPLFKIPGGEVKFAFGAQYSELENNYQLIRDVYSCPTVVAPGPNNPPCSVQALRDDVRSGSASRDITALYGELFVPIIGADNALPFVRRLDLSLAVRYEEYSDFGDTTNPRVGLAWEPIEGLTVRSAYSTAFRAPNLIELSASTLPLYLEGALRNNTGNTAYGPLNGAINAVILGGANPSLGPEESTNFSAGFDWRPKFASGLKLSTNYYKIDYTDKITTLPVFNYLSSAANGVTYANFITRFTQPSTCVQTDPSTWSPILQAVMTDIPVLNTGNICNANTILDGRWVNAASVVQEGIDFEATHEWNTEYGLFTVGGSFTKILKIEEENVPGIKTTPEPLNRIFYPIDFRARAQLSWAQGPWNINFLVNYTPSYLNDAPITLLNPRPQPAGAPLPVSKVPSWTTVDFGVTYRFEGGDQLWNKGVRLSLNVQNVTDDEPPVVLNQSASFDARAHNIYGRIWTFQATKSF